MNPLPENIPIYEFNSSTIWFDENDALWSVSKKTPPQTVEQAKRDIEKLKNLIGDKKACLLLDVTNSSETTRDLREYVAEELLKITRAMAVVSRSVLGKMFVNLFFAIKKQPYPVKMFNDINEAKEWLKQYL